MTDAETGEVLNHYTYDAFGNTMEGSEQVHNRFRYNGEQYDPLTNQYYLRARFYNPVIARFTQEDTYYGDGLNLYQYCANNPIGYADPSGHNICPVQRDLYHKYVEEYRKAHDNIKYEDIPYAEKKKMFDRMRTELGKKSFSNKDYTRGYDVTPKNSTVDMRKKGTPADPSKNGYWVGERGESKFISDDPRVKGILEKYNTDGVEYRNGMPDFSPFAVAEVKKKNMTDNRPANFSQADALLAKEWSKGGTEYSAQDVAKWRADNKYTWHELNDVETIQLVPSGINAPIFKHLGECSEYGMEDDF